MLSALRAAARRTQRDALQSRARSQPATRGCPLIPLAVLLSRDFWLLPHPQDAACLVLPMLALPVLVVYRLLPPLDLCQARCHRRQLYTDRLLPLVKGRAVSRRTALLLQGLP